ncbi:cyanoexosortase B [Phormidium tenue]|uniref:Cyanoexosortase B n=1 Tax=Phormidium tenue NIES-30 TaxID=549789 RepID=A0A1U7J3W7_9CYAN|nr:cyanoexosortase B [Phormidium tenue]MBD2233110.1 cyanoexosortase B [Phormidium tenue FACHB-1052]OKH47086.1 cyanoexosortase B [Phormidium tenue NIES-30]
MPSLRRYLTPPWAIAALLAILYGPLLLHWVDGWLNKSISIQHEYFSHGLLGLPFAAYIAWGKRQAWAELPNRCHPLGLGLVGLAALMYLTHLPDWMNLSLPVMLVGLCLSLKSIAGLRLQAISLILVALATPNQLPYLIEPYILPLQRLIASVAGFLLVQLGVPVTVETIYLFVNGQTVEVAPHCAGLKMLFTSLYVALMLAYWTGAYTSRLRTVLFVGGTVAISVVGNILRNTFLSYFHGTGRDGAFDWLHESWGGDLYSALMLLTIILLLRLIQDRVPDRLNLAVQSPSSSV